jgi:hypothetical protein
MMHFYNKNKELDNDLTYFFLFRIEIWNEKVNHWISIIQ